MGPVITRDHYNRVMGYIETGRKEGAEVVVGGKHPSAPELATGYFIECTVFDGVRHGMQIEQ